MDPERTSAGVFISAAGGVTNGNGDINGDAVNDHGIHSPACSLCQRVLEPDNEDVENINLCGDCKFLLSEDLGTPFEDNRLRPHGERGARYSSSESIDNLFSQQLSQIISRMRQNLSNISWDEDQSVDSDAFALVLPRASSRTTPSGSQRWQRVLSDTESDGFDIMDSPYGESDTNWRFRRYRTFHSESDGVSFSGYGGDSDASVDGNSFLDTEIFAQADAASNLDSDADIDPMHARLDHWDSEEEEEEDDDWEEADEEDAVEATEARMQLSLFNSNVSEGNGHSNWNRQLHSRGGLINQRMRQGRQTYNHDIFINVEESITTPDAGNFGDYVTGFEQAIQAVAETDITRRGAPPAALSYVHNLPRVTINKEHQKHGDLACAICKDALTIGTNVNQLPCLHVYHPFCIIPWLSARNSCPLCRYELPTDDREYEGRKRTSGTLRTPEIQQQDASEDSSSNDSDGDETDEPQDHGQSVMEQRELEGADPSISISARQGSDRGWFFLAASPIFSLLGIVLVLWLGNPRGGTPTSQCNFPERSLRQIQVPEPSQHNQRANRRRWRFPF